MKLSTSKNKTLKVSDNLVDKIGIFILQGNTIAGAAKEFSLQIEAENDEKDIPYQRIYYRCRTAVRRFCKKRNPRRLEELIVMDIGRSERARFNKRAGKKSDVADIQYSTLQEHRLDFITPEEISMRLSDVSINGISTDEALEELSSLVSDIDTAHNLITRMKITLIEGARVSVDGFYYFEQVIKDLNESEGKVIARLAEINAFINENLKQKDKLSAILKNNTLERMHEFNQRKSR